MILGYRPGSITGRALAHLLQQGATPARVLAEVAGCDEVDLRIALAAPIKAGQVDVERREGLRWYRARSRGAGKPRLCKADGGWVCAMYRRRGRGRTVMGAAGQGETPLEAFNDWRQLDQLQRAA